MFQTFLNILGVIGIVAVAALGGAVILGKKEN